MDISDNFCLVGRLKSKYRADFERRNGNGWRCVVKEEMDSLCRGVGNTLRDASAA